ncbi:MAG TPA: hypothetical protein VLJ16_06910, partial [Acidobacteriota bacterium]|nr:hypothetical protein [Acidobacteriota bacterium]
SPVAEIRVKDLANGEERIIPTDPTLIESAPKISPDGSTVCYDGVRQGTRRTFIMAGKDTTAKEACQGCVITGFFGDPRFALIVEEGRRLAKLDLSTGERTPLLETSTGRISDPALSPDDRWVAFVLSRPDGRPELRIAPLDGAPPAEDRWILAYSEPNALASPAWSPNGRILYYLAERDGPCALWSQPLEPGSKAPSGEPTKIFDPRPFGISLNIPRGNATLAVAKDKLALWGGQAKGNIFMATPRPRK